MSRIKYTKEILESIVKTSETMADVCRSLGVKPNTGAQTHLRNKIRNYEIDTSHFKGSAWAKGRKFNPKRDIKEYLQLNGRFIKSNDLKHRLIKEGLKNYQCEKCNLIEWLGEKIPIELDHVNGNNKDNRIENLRILCPNCHAQTDTYCSKNIRASGQIGKAA